MPRANGITIKSTRELDYMREAGRVASLTKAVLKDRHPTGSHVPRVGRPSRARDPLAWGPSRRSRDCTAFPRRSVRRSTRRSFTVYRQSGSWRKGHHKRRLGRNHRRIPQRHGVHGRRGRIDDDSQRLIAATEESLRLAVVETRVGRRVGDIGAAVQSYAEGLGYGVVRQYVGHGIGRALHEDPSVPNYGTPGRGAQLRVGMTVAIEPMLNLGTWDTRVLDDGWTVVTADGSRSAHFEDTVAVTENGPEVLTA